MTQPLVVIGGGGFGRETLDVVEAINRALPGSYEVLGVVDDAPTERTRNLLEQRGVAWLGGVDAWLASDDSAHYVIGIGSPATRHALASRLDAIGRQAATLVHPRAGIGSVGNIGEGTVICAGVEVSTNVTIGRHVHLNPAATIGHDSVLEGAVSINPAAVISGDVRVAERVLIGAGAVVLQGLTVGTDAVVGAAACVVRDVDPGSVLKGVPAR